MKILAISDVHANADALDCIQDLIESVDQVICLGDLVGYYCDVNEVIERLREHSVIAVRGNHEDFLLRGMPENVPSHVRWAIGHASDVITDENRNYLASLPLVWGGELFGRSLLLSHGSPWRPMSDYLYADSQKVADLEMFDFDIIAFGQTHRPWSRTVNNTCIINCGSVGQSRHRPGVVNAWIIDLRTMQVDLIERTYDPIHVIKKARKHGASEWIMKHLS